MPILQQKRTAADDFLDAPEGAPAPATTAAPSTADAFLDAPDVQGPPEAKDMPGTVAFGARQRAGIVQPKQDEAKQGIVGNVASNWWDQVNPTGIVKAIADFAPQEPKDLLVARPVRQIMEAGGNLISSGAEDIGAGNTSTGIRKIASGMVPMFGPAINKAGEQVNEGDYPGAVGTSLGIATNLAAPQIIKSIRGGVPQGIRQGASKRLYRSSLKPSITKPAAGERMVQTGLREGIPVSKAGLEKLGSLVDDLNGQISGEIASDPTRQISPARAVQNTWNLETKFRNQVNPEADLGAIEASREEFLNQRRSPQGLVQSLSPQDAQSLKQGTYRQLKDRAYGELKSATIEAQKALARGLKEELVQQFPEIQALNAREGALLQLEPAIQKAIARSANREVMGIGGPLAGGAAKVITGSSGVAAAIGVLREVIRYPAVASKLAIAINQGSRGATSLAQARAMISGYLNQIGNTSDADTSQPPAGQANP